MGRPVRPALPPPLPQRAAVAPQRARPAPASEARETRGATATIWTDARSDPREIPWQEHQNQNVMRMGAVKLNTCLSSGPPVQLPPAPGRHRHAGPCHSLRQRMDTRHEGVRAIGEERVCDEG